ncbi:MAG: hypothetical protein ACRDTV_06955, partial [Mycobacterium sp.]
MSGYRGRGRTRRAANARARRRALGAGGAVGAFLAFGMSPLNTAPAARADDFGLLDNILNPIISSLSGVDPT